MRKIARSIFSLLPVFICNRALYRKLIPCFATILFAALLTLTTDACADWAHEPVDINSDANPGSVNAHANSGGRRIVRIENTTIAICPHGSGERTYRSTDNGQTWDEIDLDGAPSGCLITGPEKRVFHFYRRGDHIYMVRFRFDESPPAPVAIYSDPNLSEGGHGAYNMINATVDADGVLYVLTHWDDQNSEGGDSLYLIKSMDQGETWTPAGSAAVIHQGSVDHSWGYAHFDVTTENELVGVYSEWGSKSIQYARSADKGETWDITELASGSIYNPAILPVGNDTLYIFAQSNLSSTRGLVFRKSTDDGNSWSDWQSIDNASLSGYADPSPALGSDGQLFVAYRSGARPDLAGVYGGSGCRARLAMSENGGDTWSFPDDYFYDFEGDPTERTGTRNQTRYQTWHNYGGPLEWIWMQYKDGGADRPIYYDINTDIEIMQQVPGAAVWMNFDELPVTAENEIPGSGGGWLYTTATQNPDSSYGMTAYDRAGWRSTSSYPNHADVFNFFCLFPNFYYSDHMGWPTYGFLEIDNHNAASGNSLRYRVTGGVNALTCPCGEDEVCGFAEAQVCNNNGLECTEGETRPCETNGLKITTKQHYLDYLNADQNPIAGGIKIGSPYVYFMNTGPNPGSSGQPAVPFLETAGNNRLSMYVFLPEEKGNFVDNPVDARESPATTFDIGPFNDVGGHWYHSYNVQGGGWIHVVVDGHPQHNNSFSSPSLYPYPSSAVRDMGYDYFATMYRWYFAVVNPYGQTAQAPYSVWFDEIEFYNDSEPQNNETINSPAIGYYPDRTAFEIGFNDKYANNQYSYSTYELRYSFDQITNDNWDQATPVHTQADDRISYGIAANTDGRFEKFNSYSRSVWAPFKLASTTDEARLTPGTKVYFAIKDISQVDGDSQVPVDGHNIYGNWATGGGGRDYQNHGDTFDYAGDQPVLNLIKRIDYTVPAPGGTGKPGDINADDTVDLTDVILALQVSAGLGPSGISLKGDAIDDGRITIVEAIIALRKTGGLVAE